MDELYEHMGQKDRIWWRIHAQGDCTKHISVRIRAGLMGAVSSWRALEVTRANGGGTRCIQMSSNWGAPNWNLEFICRMTSKQGTNERKLLEDYITQSMECLRNRNLMLQSPCWGNRKELLYLMPIDAVTHEGNFNTGETQKIRKDQGMDRNNCSLNLKTMGDVSTSRSR